MDGSNSWVVIANNDRVISHHVSMNAARIAARALVEAQKYAVVDVAEISYTYAPAYDESEV